jgi:hypothetical protein
MKKVFNANESAAQKGWHRHTELSVDLKTMLRSDKRMQTGKEYQGVLRRDSDAFIDDFVCRDAHFTFVETLPWTCQRNPRVFKGRYITITRRQDGTLRPNFRPVKMDAGFSPERYAAGVATELMWALEGLVGENVTI